jgi:hypothetical protein
MANSVALTTASAGTLTVTGNFTANDTVITNSEIYKFVATPAAAGDVDIGADAETSLANLVLAMNGTGTPGATTYFTGTVPLAGFTATSTATVLTITPDGPGDWANACHFEEGTDGGGTFSITAIVGASTAGAGDLFGSGGWIEQLISENQINSEVLQELKKLTTAAD